MGFDYSKLRGRIREKYGTQEKFAVELGITSTSLSRKLNNITGFAQKEIERAVTALQIEHDEIPLYFFTQKFN